MIEDLLGFFESFGHWILGAPFGIAGLIVAVTVPGSDDLLLRSAFALLLLHTSAMLLIGFGLKKAKRSLVISWLVVFSLLIGYAAWKASTQSAPVAPSRQSIPSGTHE
jgi:hypothetical protein